MGNRAFETLPSREQCMITERRMFHRLAEPGWCEVFTASKVVAVLMALGWSVRSGADVVDAQTRMNLPSQRDFDFFYERALEFGADPDIASAVRDGFTGVVGTLRGVMPGPVVAFRFDLDANHGVESDSPSHRPNQHGFASLHKGAHHNCGHDGHVAIGLGLARAMTEIRDGIIGEIRLIFQPAEEGLRGAKSMVAAGVLDGVDYLIGCHLGVQAQRTGEIISGYKDILGSMKLDVHFVGKSAHAAISPHEGHNALLAACVAAQNLMAIPRHGDGDTRINIGSLSGGGSRNTIPDNAILSFEIRADQAPALDFLRGAAEAVIDGASTMHGVDRTVTIVGESRSASSDPALMQIVRSVAETNPEVSVIRDNVAFRGSDDAAEMMRTVQAAGGKAVYLGIGTGLAAVHHNTWFDFDEQSLGIGLDLLVNVAQHVMRSNHVLVLE